MMRVVQHDDGWWIHGFPECEPQGPFDTKKEAKEIRISLQRTLRFWDDHDFWTSDRDQHELKIPMKAGVSPSRYETGSDSEVNFVKGPIADRTNNQVLFEGVRDMTLKQLDKLENLKTNSYKTGEREGKRKIGKSRGDEVSKTLADLATPSDVAELAIGLGMSKKEIMHRAETAANFGGFRMIIGNRIRAMIKIKKLAGQKKIQITNEQAAAAGCGKTWASASDLEAVKKVTSKAKPKKATKKAEKKTTKKTPAKKKKAKLKKTTSKKEKATAS